MVNKYYTLEIRAKLKEGEYYDIPKKFNELAEEKGFYLSRGLEDRGGRDSILVSWFNNCIMPDGDYLFFKGSKCYFPKGEEDFYLKLVSINQISKQKQKSLVDLCKKAGVKNELTAEVDSEFRPR